MCQFVAYQLENPSLSRRTLMRDIRLSLQTRLPASNASKRFRGFCRIGAKIIPRAITASSCLTRLTSGPRPRVRKHDLDQRAGAAAGLDLEFGAVGFDQGFRQRQAD